MLNASITDSSASICINITSSDIIFDGAGYTIDGNDASNSNGVYVYNATTTLTNITVKNLTVTDRYKGIYYRSAAYGNIFSNNASSNAQYGIYLDSSSNNTIYNNYFNNTTLNYNQGRELRNIPWESDHHKNQYAKLYIVSRNIDF